MNPLRKKQSIIRNLMKHSKLGDRKQFFELAENSGIFNNLQSLTSVEASKLIYSFSNLKIQDKNIWQILENLFLYNEKKMNMHDFIMCTWAFQKYSNNPQIWDKIENAININFLTWKQDQIKNPNIGLAVYSFAMQNHGSQKLWQKFLLISKETLPYLDERNIVLIGYSFCKKKIQDEGFWRIYEKTLLATFSNFRLVNQITVLYSLAMTNQGSNDLWRLMETPFIQNNNQFKARDIVQIVFAFGKQNKGSHILWKNLENIIFEIWNDFTFTHINQLSYSFYISNKGSQEFWEKFFSQPVNPEFLKGSSKPEYQFNEIVFFARILRKKIHNENKDLWDQLSKQFNKYLNIPGVLLKSQVPISYQTQFFKTNPEFYTQEVEKLYIKKLENYFKNGGRGLITQVINVTYFFNDIQLATETAWNRLIDLILNNEIMKQGLHPKDLSGFSQCLYIIANLNPYITDQQLQKIDEFCCNDKIYSLFTLKCMAIILRTFQQHKNHNKFIKKRIKEILERSFPENDAIFSLILTLVNRNNYIFYQLESTEFTNIFEEQINAKLKNGYQRQQFIKAIRNILFNKQGDPIILNEELPQVLGNVWNKYLDQNTDITKFLVNRQDIEEEQQQLFMQQYQFGDIEGYIDQQDNNNEISKYFEKQQENQKQKQF